MRHLLAVALSLALCACTGDLRPVSGSTVRVAEPTAAPGTELALRIFTSPADCGRLKPADQGLCLPWVDRASGEVHLAFQFFLGSSPWPMPISEEHLRVVHQGSVIQDGQNQQRVSLVPHDPVRAEQLFVVLIDGSASMNEPAENPRIERVRRALLLPEVVASFFPSDVRTGVVLLEFSGGTVRPVGGPMEVIERAGDYRKRVRSLRASGGYTYLYDAIAHATGDLLTRDPTVSRHLQASPSAATIIALTDGYNNERADDTCGTNAPRLQGLLGHLEEVRGPEVDLRTRPQVFTVGLGRPSYNRFELPEDLRKVTPAALCSRARVGRRIDGDLEKAGIDNASLEWIAAVGGGSSYVRQDADGLGEAFRAAAAERHAWFEVRYALDPFHLRRSFETRLRLMAFAEAESAVRIHPSAWLDAPPGVRAEDGWHRRSSLRRSVALVMPLLGLLVTIGFLPPAVFNLRRILAGRLRPPPPSGEQTRSGGR